MNRQRLTFGEFREGMARQFDLVADSLQQGTSFLEDLAFDSLRMLQLGLFFEELGVAMPDDIAWEIETVGDAYAYYGDAVAVDAGGSPAATPVTAAEESDRRQGPLSSAQMGIWLHCQLEPESAFYNNKIVVRLQGPLDVGLLERGINQIVRRHEPLRSMFPVVNGEPVQQVQAGLQVSVPVVPVQAELDGDGFDAALKVAADEVSRPFELSRDPPIRVLLLQLGPEDHVLVVVMHAIVSDGSSIMIFLEELATAYTAFARGEVSPLDELPLQHLDWVRREAAEQHRFTAGIDYWVGQLADAPPLLALPTDHARPASASHSGAVHHAHLSTELTEELLGFCRSEGVTLYMVVLAAFQALLHRYTGQQDILVGSPVTHRIRPEVRRMIGYLVNTFVLRTALAHDLTFRELLGQVRDTAIAAYRHSYVPFEKVMQALRAPRAPSHHPVFQVILALQETLSGPLDESRVRIPGLRLTFPPSLDIGTSLVDVTLSVYQLGNRIELAFEYSTDLFDAAAIARMEHQLSTLLEGAIHDPSTPVSMLPLLSGDEQRLVIEGVRSESPAVGSDGMAAVLDAFEEQVRQRPKALGAVGASGARTYAELDSESQSLAHELASLGVAHGTPVALNTRDPLTRLVALLAVLRAGGTYAPAGPAGIVVTNRRAALAVEQTLTAVDAPALPGAPDFVLDGVPVGSTILSTSLAWLAGDESPLRRTGVLIAAGAVPEEWWILASLLQLSRGGRVIYGQDAGPQEATAETAVIGSSETILSMRPNGRIDPRSTFVLAGEPPMVGPWRRDPGPAVAAVYGSLEAGPCTAFCWVGQAPDGARPIGRPIAGRRLYVLNERLQLAPPGIVGRLYVGGLDVDAPAPRPRAGPSPQPDPFVAAGLMLQTQDLARYRPDGTFELLGTVGTPCQIDGVPVMPCKLEAVLGEHPGIVEAVVGPRFDGGRDVGLSAAVVPRPGAEPSPTELREHLHRRVARHLVPEEVRIHRRLPRTPRGRLDRAALDGYRPEALRAAKATLGTT